MKAMLVLSGTSMLCSGCALHRVSTATIDAVTLHPVLVGRYSCAEHYEGELPYPGDALGTDCTMLEGGRTFRTDGATNQDYFVWNQPVLAPFDGRVVRVVVNPRTNEPGERGESPASMIVFEREDGVMAMIGHLSDIRVIEGEEVKAGQAVARVGNNGVSTSPHVHIGAWCGDQALQIRWDLRAMGRLREPQTAATRPTHAGRFGGDGLRKRGTDDRVWGHVLRGTTALLLFLTVDPAPAVAQARAWSPEPGARVRVWIEREPARYERIVGTLGAVTAEHFFIRLDAGSGDEVRIPRESLVRVDVSRGRRSKFVTGLLIGGFAGAVGGAAVGAAFIDLEDTPPSIEVGTSAAFGFVVGALLGGIAGTAVHADAWEPVTVTLAHLGDADRHFGIQVSLRF